MIAELLERVEKTFLTEQNDHYNIAQYRNPNVEPAYDFTYKPFTPPEGWEPTPLAIEVVDKPDDEDPAVEGTPVAQKSSRGCCGCCSPPVEDPAVEGVPEENTPMVSSGKKKKKKNAKQKYGGTS